MIGLVLVVLGAASAAALVDLVIENAQPGKVDLTLFGYATGHVPSWAVLAEGAVLAALVVVFLTLGVSYLGRSRHRRRDEVKEIEDHEEVSLRNAKLQAVNELLEFRVQQLTEKVAQVQGSQRDAILAQRGALGRDRKVSDRVVEAKGLAGGAVLQVPEYTEDLA